MPRDLLLEIGTEEIPAGFLASALEHLDERAERAFAEARIEVESVHVYGTPRRMVLSAAEVADTQPDSRETIVGPPARIAFDESGAATKAAIGFARRNGVDVDALQRTTVEGKKGEYVVCERVEIGRPSIEVLPDLLLGLITGLPWPKSMRWGAGEESFVRPVHWIVALFGEDVIPMRFAGIASSRQSRGHRFLAPQPIEVDDARFEPYAEALRAAFVIVDPDRRRQLIRAELDHLTDELGVAVRPDDELLYEVSYLVEYPKAVCGEFDASYLEVPEEVIVSAMRSHQRYFAVEAPDGTLTNRFVTIAGTVTRDLDVVRAGNERVLAARLADARFFFQEDRKRSLDEFAAKLGDVVFQADLGSIGAKVERVIKNGEEIASEVGVPSDVVRRAASLCKADLVSQMVYEFPELQGVMGAHYARLSGEPKEVASAIREHYLPRGSSDDLPSGDVGAIVGLADRIDTLVGCFAVGLKPTGSADPYGLRRAALAILGILLDREWAVPLSMLVHAAMANLREVVEVDDEHGEEVLEFLRKRLGGLLGEMCEPDCVEATLSAGFDYVPDVRARALAISEFRKRTDFEPMAAAFKRVANILKGRSQAELGAVDDTLFREAEEIGLSQALDDARRRAEDYLTARDYPGALTILADLKGPVDRFFDAVLVMDDDPRVRDNRLALLGGINAMFTRIADFRQLSV